VTVPSTFPRDKASELRTFPRSQVAVCYKECQQAITVCQQQGAKLYGLYMSEVFPSTEVKHISYIQTVTNHRHVFMNSNQK